MISTIVAIFIISSILGWSFEYVVWNKSTNDTLVSIIFGRSLPFRFMYGIGAVMLYLLSLANIHIVYKVLLAVLFINSIECIGGLLSYKYSGVQTWKYDSNICMGYVSSYTSIGWFVISLIIIWIFQLLKL